MKSKFIPAALLLAVVAGCAATQSSDPAPAATAASAKAIEAHMQFLAADELAGRETGSKEHEIASLYIATQLQALGLEPAGDNGSYYQRVPLRQARLAQESAKFTLHTDGKDTQLSYPKAFFTGPSLQYTQTDITAPLVFAGYGMVSEEFGLNDYANLDVKGKIVVLLTGRPDSLPSEEAAHLSSQKTRLAAERGAIGIISVHTPDAEKTRPYANSLLYLNTPDLSWVNDKGIAEKDYPSIKVGAYLHMDAAKALFADAPQSLEQIYAMLEKKEVPKGFALTTSASLTRESTHSMIQSQNVVAVLEGSDPVLKNEYVVVTAHSDHIGIGNDLRSKDKINNGLMDNAAGVAILLETARLYTQSAVKPKRSILFLHVTGEEHGLLGSRYYSENPLFPLANTVADVNIDMIGRRDELHATTNNYVYIIGANRLSAELDHISAAMNQKYIGLDLDYRFNDPKDPNRFYERSDHYNFAKHGIPSVFFFNGVHADYHKKTDEADKIEYDALEKRTQLAFVVAWELANRKNRIQVDADKK